jgi:hypothetical protein
LQDLDLPLDLLLLDGFEHLDDAFGRGREMDGFEDLTVIKSEYVGEIDRGLAAVVRHSD